MLGAQRLLADRERPLVERLGLGVGTGGVVEIGEVVERGGGVGVLGAQRLLRDRERACGKWYGSVVLALTVEFYDLRVQLFRLLDRPFLCSHTCRKCERK